MNIHSIRPLTQAAPAAPVEKADKGAGFSELIGAAVESVNAAQVEAQAKAGEMSAGITSIDEAMIAMEKADLGFRMMTQVRNKVVDAYREIMRMNF